MGIEIPEQYGGAGQTVNYPNAQPQQTDAILLNGPWADESQYVDSKGTAHFLLRFHATDVFIVAGTDHGSMTATVTLDKTDAGFSVTESHLDMTAKIPGIDQEKFTAIANGAKAGCPISRLLKANITLDAKLEA